MIEFSEKNGDARKTCTEQNCNSKASFVKCINSQTSDDSQCAVNPKEPESKIGKNYNDKCFTFIERTVVSRGCLNERNRNLLPNI